MSAATSARPAAERDSIVLFPGRDLMTVSLSELADCQFQGEASASLIEVSATTCVVKPRDGTPVRQIWRS